MYYEFTPLAGYHVDNVVVNGQSLGPLTYYIFTGQITEPQTISVTFVPN